MVYNLERLLETPHFRSYWVQRNATRLSEFSAVAADLDRVSFLVSPSIELRLALIGERMEAAVLESPLRLGPLRRPLAAGLRRAVSDQLQGSVAPTLSRALQRVLELSDEDLALLLMGLSTELAAWGGHVAPLSDEDLSQLGGPARRLFDALG